MGHRDSRLPTDSAGDVAHRIDPTSREAIADGLRCLAEDAALRASLLARGAARAAWVGREKAAAATETMCRLDARQTG